MLFINEEVGTDKELQNMVSTLEENLNATGETNFLAPKEQLPKKLSGKRTVAVITLESRH